MPLRAVKETNEYPIPENSNINNPLLLPHQQPQPQPSPMASPRNVRQKPTLPIIRSLMRGLEWDQEYHRFRAQGQAALQYVDIRGDVKDIHPSICFGGLHPQNSSPTYIRQLFWGSTPREELTDMNRSIILGVHAPEIDDGCMSVNCSGSRVGAALARVGGARPLSQPLLLVEVGGEVGDVSAVTPDTPPLPLPRVLVAQGLKLRFDLVMMAKWPARASASAACPRTSGLPDTRPRSRSLRWTKPS